MLWPVLNSLLALLFHPPPPGTRFWRDPRDRLLRSMFAIIFLADYAGMALDAIVRVAYRRITSHRLLLEWETAQDAHRRARNRQRQFILSRLWIPAACVLLFVGAASRGTSGDGSRSPVPPFVGALSGGGDGDQSPGEKLARRNR